MNNTFECTVIDPKGQKYELLLFSEDFNENLKDNIAVKMNKKGDDFEIERMDILFRIILKDKKEIKEEDEEITKNEISIQ